MGQFYSKINTLYKRHEDGPLKHCIIPGDFSDAETEVLKDCRWKWYEKIDGTNMSYALIYKGDTGTGGIYDNYDLEIRGKTPEANIPAHLLSKMKSLLTKERAVDYFTCSKDGIPPLEDIEIFGEGYGVKIQKGGNYIRDDVGFIVFDIRIGKWWLTQDACDKIASDLNLQRVPYIGEMTVPEAEAFVKTGFKSKIAENPDYDAEGLVGHAPLDMLRRNGSRILVKVKTCDYRDLERKLAAGKTE